MITRPRPEEGNPRKRSWLGLLAIVIVMGLGVGSLFSLQAGPSWGVSLASVRGRIFVSAVKTGSIGDSAGVRPGDFILRLDGRNPANSVQGQLVGVSRLTWQDTQGVTHHSQAPNPSTAFLLALEVASLIFAALGGIVYRWSPDPIIRVAFLLFGLTVAVVLETSPPADLGYQWAFAVSSVGAILAATAFCLFAAAFPHTLRVYRRLAAVVLAGTISLSGAILWFVLSDTYFPSWFDTALWAWFAVQLLTGVALLAIRAIQPSTRGRLIPVMIGCAVGIAPIVFLSAIPYLLTGSYIVRAEYAAAGAVAIPIGFTYAILRHHLFGLDALVRRFLLGVTEVGCVALLVILAWSSVTRAGGGAPAVLVGALLLGIAIPTIVPRFRLGVDALLYPRVARARHGLDLTQPNGLPELGGQLTRVARDVVPVQWAMVILRGSRAGETLDRNTQGRARVIGAAGDAPRPGSESLDWSSARVQLPGAANQNYTAIPLANGENVFGALLVGPRLDDSPLSGLDLEAFQLLVARSVVPIEAALLREQAEEEERYREGLSRFARALAVAGSPRDILEIVCQQGHSLLDTTTCGIWVRSENGPATLVTSSGDPRLLPAECPSVESEEPRPFGQGATGVEAVGGGSVLTFALGGSAQLAATGVLVRAGNLGEFGPRDLRRLAEVIEYAAGALGRAEAVSAAAEAETLREINRVRTEVFDMVSHDLQSPLTVVRGYAELLQMRNDEAFAGEAAEAILNAYRACQNLIDDLLTSARMEKGRLAVHLEPIDLAAVLDQLIAGFHVVPGGTRLALEAQEGLTIRADRTRLEQMVGNLISNALRYAPRGPIVVRSFADEQAVIVEVSDEGPGIAPEDLPRIWEKFYRAGTGSAAPRGTGVGLAVVQALAELHGGRAEVASVVGQGTTFRLFFPLMRSPARAPIEDSDSGVAPDRARAPKLNPAVVASN